MKALFGIIFQLENTWTRSISMWTKVGGWSTTVRWTGCVCVHAALCAGRWRAAAGEGRGSGGGRRGPRATRWLGEGADMAMSNGGSARSSTVFGGLR